MHFRSSILAAAAALAVSGIAFAHGGHDHVRGTVVAVDASHVEVKSGYGKTVSIALTPDTKFSKDNAAAKAEDLKVGSRVVIDTDKAGDSLQALEVKIGTPAPASQTPKP